MEYLTSICRGGRPCPPSKSGDFRDSYGVKRETRRFFAGCAWFFIPLVGADDIESLFLTVACRGGRPCPPSKSGDFRDPYDAKRETRRFFAGRAWFFIPLVGADDPVRPLKSCNFVRSFVGADAHIAPSKYCDFASDFRKNAQLRRADRVVRPYGAKSKPDAITPLRPMWGVSVWAWGGSMWASTPTA